MPFMSPYPPCTGRKKSSNGQKGRRFEIVETADTRYTTFSSQKICPLGSYCVLGVRYLCPAGRYGGTLGLKNQACSGNVSEGYFGPPGSISITEHECGGADFSVHLVRVRLTLSLKALHLVRPYETKDYRQYMSLFEHTGSDNSLDPDKVNQIQPTIYGYLSTAEGALTGSIIQNPTDGNFQVLEGLETTTDGVGSGLKLNIVISGGPMNGGTGASSVTAITVHTAGRDYKPDDTVTVSHLFMANTEVDLVLRLRDQDFQTICKRYKYDAMYLSLYNDQGGERVRSTQHVCPPGSYCKNGHIWEHLPGYFGRTNGSYNATGSGECQPGFYCPAGSTSPQQVPCGGPHVYCPRGRESHTSIAGILYINWVGYCLQCYSPDNKVFARTIRKWWRE